MNGRIIPTRIVTILEEGREYRPSLIGYAKRAHSTKYVQDTDDEDRQIGHAEVVQWQHHLYINLWLFELEFEWITEAK